MKRILAALDSSDMATLVLKRAIDLAFSSGAKLRLLRVVSTVDAPPPPDTSEPEDDTNALMVAAEADLLFLEERIPEEYRGGVVVRVGCPGEEICTIARDYRADTVVIGAHGHGTSEHVLGTTAAAVVNHIDRPVMIVRPIAKHTNKKETPVMATAKVEAPEEGFVIHEAATLAGAAESERTTLVDRATTPEAELLRAEHARLEGVYATLLSAYRDGDWAVVRAHWQVFESALRAHMETEEQQVFPAFRATNPEEARGLLSEHDELRRQLEVLGVNIELHAVTEADAEALVRRLRAHGEREERFFYPWIAVALEPAAVAKLSSAA